jgi:hypothetical protein
MHDWTVDFWSLLGLSLCAFWTKEKRRNIRQYPVRFSNMIPDVRDLGYEKRGDEAMFRSKCRIYIALTLALVAIDTDRGGFRYSQSPAHMILYRENFGSKTSILEPTFFGLGARYKKNLNPLQLRFSRNGGSSWLSCSVHFGRSVQNHRRRRYLILEKRARERNIGGVVIIFSWRTNRKNRELFWCREEGERSRIHLRLRLWLLNIQWAIWSLE